jgi:hypothetical protein
VSRALICEPNTLERRIEQWKLMTLSTNGLAMNWVRQ